MTNTLEKLLNQLSDFAPKFMGALLIIILGYIISKILARVVRKILEKIKVDRFGESLNQVEFVSKSNAQIKISVILSKFMFYFLFTFFLIAASDVLAMEAISSLVSGLFNLFPKLLVGFIFLIFGTLLSELLRKILEATLTSLGIASAKMIAMFLFYFLLINVFILAISQADINTDFLQQNISIIIAGGVIAFAIGYGLASKDIVANFLSSLYTKDKLSVGDIVEINGDRGQVISIDKTSVTLASEDKKVIYPLKYFLHEKVAIFTHHKRLDK